MKNIFLLIVLSCFFLTACEDVIEVDLEDDQTQLVVDAWINNKMETQVIKLRKTIPYFEGQLAPVVTGANVQVIDNEGVIFNFTDENNDGDYIWEPTPNAPFGKIGNEYGLLIQHDGKEYTSATTMNRTIPVDSLTWEFEESSLVGPEGYYAQFFARDLDGLGDTYWIKTYKNGVFLNKPQEINIAFDAGFTAGSEVDGIIMIPPIRELVNRLSDGGDDPVDTDDLPPWELGDEIKVEIHSLAPPSFYYLEQARIQLTLGDAAIFAEPPSNVPTNILSSDEKETPQGFFNVAAVTALTEIIRE